jgi:transcriptional regulator GlxA family with amidase domain
MAGSRRCAGAGRNFSGCRRVKRARRIPQGGGASLAKVAGRPGFLYWSRLNHRFTRPIGSIPGQFRQAATPAR